MTRHESSPPIEPGSSVLVTSSSTHLAGDEAPFDFLSSLEPSSIVTVTYDQSADAFLRGWRNRVGTIPEYARVITVGGSARSTTTESSPHDVVRPVPRPEDLTEVTAEIAIALHDSPDGTGLLFDSLTALLQHVSLSKATSFLKRISTLLAETGGVGYFHLDRSAHDATTMTTLYALTDSRVERDGDCWVLQPSVGRISDTISYDVLFDVLRSRRRRNVLRYLLFTTQSVSLEELTTAMTERERGNGEMDETERRRECTSLQQVHLPKLDDLGFVDYDSTTQWVSIRENARNAEPFLALIDE